jgi:hypothetical protein
MIFYQTVLVLLAATQVYSWGSQGHQLTGAIAQKYVSSATAKTVLKLLPSSWEGSLSRTSTWADEVKRSKKYANTRTLHYVDVEYTSATSCNGYKAERDCPDGNCIVGALGKYVKDLDCKNDNETRSDALKFIVHFMGDITQPLHICGRDKGGNGAIVEDFSGKKTNLHSVWDSSIIEQRIKKDFGNSQTKYLEFLLSKAKEVSKADKDKWTSCLSKPAEYETQGTDAVTLACAGEWATDAEGLNCDVVWPAYDSNPDQDFGAKYYEAALPALERQLIKAGVRMSVLLDKVLKTC